MLNYTTIPEQSFARGIDARSAENQIVAGFVRDLVNADIIEGRIRKRAGYASYAGNLPLRVISFKQTDSTNQLCLTFDGSIDLSTVPSCPILVYGKSSTVVSGGPFTAAANTAKWYPSWTTTLRKVFTSSPSTGTISALSDEHNIATTNMFVGLAESSSPTNLSNSEILWGDNGGVTPVELSIDKTSYNITAGYSNNKGSDVDVFLYYADKSYIATETYTTTFSLPSSPSSQPMPFITANVHQLSNYNIVYQLWKDDTTKWTRVKPTSFSVNDSTGRVDMELVNDTGSPITYKLILSTVPAGNRIDYNIVENKTSTVTVENVTSPFVFYTLYAVSGNVLEEIMADSVSYNAETKKLTLVFDNGTIDAVTARLFYTYGTIRANQLCVTDVSSITADATDTLPQLTVYGISHEVAYGNDKKVNRRGWVTHLDSYRSPTTTHMVAGLGGNLFAALPTNEAPAALAATMNTYYPRLNARLLNATKLGPVFWDTGSAPALTRGSITHDEGGTNWATVTSVTYIDDANKYTRYALYTPNQHVTGTPITENQDYLTVKGMSHSKHNGSFLIKNVDYTSNYVILDVQNDNIDTSDYNDTATRGLGGVFTDSLTTAASSPFEENDILLSSFWGEETELSVLSVAGSITTISGVYSYLSLGAGLAITGRRTSAKIPLRTALNEATSTNLVPGDTLYYSEFERPLQVLYVNVAPDSEGNLQSAPNTIVVDEAFTWEDNLSAPSSFVVSRRWVPAETPTRDSGDSLIPLTVTRHFANNDYDNQPFLRSAMVQNNMYLTNGDDEVYKYDGSSLYRAGIIPWQPGLFMTVQKVVADGLPLAGTTVSSIAGANLVGKSIKLTVAQASAFTAKDQVQAVFTGASDTKTLTLTIASIVQEVTGTHSYLYFTDVLNVGFVVSTISLTLIYQARYSFRLNVKDNNGVTIASAVTGAEDFVVQAVPTTTEYMLMRLRLVGLPAWDHYDFSNKNIELQVYRTLWSTGSQGETPVFYKIATQACSFRENNGYIDITDALSNDSLVDPDPVVSVLSPDTVPAAWDEPARAKYITSAGNRLVLANVTDWPTLAVSYLTSAGVPATDFVGQKFVFRKDDSVTATGTDMLNCITYELRKTSNAIACHPDVSGIAGQFKVVLSSLPAGLAIGDWVYLYHKTPTQGWVSTFTAATNDTFTVPDPPGVAGLAVNDLIYFSAPAAPATLPTTSTGLLSTTKGYYIKTIGTNTFTISETYGGPAVDITAAGSGSAISTGSILDYCGWWQINGISGNTLTIKDINSNIVTTPVQFPDRALFATDPTDIPVLVDTDGNMGMASGNGPVAYNNIIRRLGMAINTTMRLVDTTLNSFKSFSPWLTARSESDTQSQLIVKQPRAEEKSPTLQIIYAANSFTSYVNGSKVGAYTTTSGTGTNVTKVDVASTINFPASGSFTLDGSGAVYTYTGSTSTALTGVSPQITYTSGQTIIPGPVTAITTRYPSRLLVSYVNYPEIFDNPWAVDDSLSSSAIDINSSDGQEITGVIPFFGESAFGAALQSGVLVVFKQNSIYLVDLSEKALGKNAVQRIETQGLGCTAPYSIAPTKDGIAFANDSGIYRLRRDQRLEYLGRFMERNWKEKVDRTFLDLVQGHHYGVGRQYKLSVPLLADSTASYGENAEVYVYNHTNETGDEPGGWARYTNHPATGWANLFQDAFFSTANGSVKRVRALGEEYDYRDDSDAIEVILETRAISFDQPGIRKVVSHAIINYRLGATSESTTVETAPDLFDQFDTTTSFKLVSQPAANGLSTVAGQDIVSIRHSLVRRRCIYITVLVKNNGINEPLEVAGMSFVVAGLNSKGIKQAASTKK